MTKLADDQFSTAPEVDQITLRNVALPRDRDVVQSIIERTGFFRPDEVAVAVELVEDRLSRGEESGYHFVFAEKCDDVAGYACYGEVACTIGSFDLFWIAVDPRFQRHGIGKLLLSAVESRVADNGGRRIYIETSGKPQYAPTRAFYQRCGFHCEARLVDFYAPDDDKIIYVKAVGNG